MRDHELLLSLEGIDGTGKTEIVRAIEGTLRDRGLPVYAVHDPPRLAPWDEVEEDYLDREGDLSKVGSAFLYLAARLDGVQREIVPALETGTCVIADRYVDSWVAYHAHRLAGTLGSVDEAIEFLCGIHSRLSDAGLLPFPRRTWLIRDDPEVALQRRAGDESHRENLPTRRRVAEVYDKLATREPTRIRVIDAHGMDLAAVGEIIVSEALDHCLLAEKTH